MSTDNLMNETAVENTAPATTSTPEIPDSSPSWFDKLPDDIKNEPSLKNFKDKDMTEVVKSYISAQREIGSRIRIPGPDASDEAKSEFYKKLESIQGIVRMPDPKDPKSVDAFLTKLGRPQTPDGYEIKLPESVPANPEAVAQFKQIAHKLGLSNAQVNELVQFDTIRSQQYLQQLEAQKTSTKELLTKEWGKDFDNRLETAKELTKHFGSRYPDAVQDLINSPAGSNPVVLMMAAELGRMYREKGLIQGERQINYGLTPEEAKARINEIRNNKSHPYHLDAHPKHREAVQQMQTLYDAVHFSEEK